MVPASVGPPAASRVATPPPRRLFGTDGVRGPVGEVITPELALALGRAAVEVARTSKPRVLIVRDTRESGPMLESALAAGVAAAGGHALLGGVLPTPACSLLVPHFGFDLGAVVSASHNPHEDNGIKFFDADGRKLSDHEEARVEAALETNPAYASRAAARPGPGRLEALHGAAADYLRALETRFEGLELAGRRILLDCANGAAHRVGPEILRRLGADVEVIAAEPDGRNINSGCGSTHVEALGERVARGGFDAAFAFDGDGDRVLGADRTGAIVDGDELIALAALHLRAAERLPGGGVAVTVMTNYGFHQAMECAGIEVATTPVGDRHVLLELERRGWGLGGEQSGHIIDTSFAASGDGVAAALLALEALGGRDLAAREAMEKLPQRLSNVHVRDREAIADAPAVWEAVEREHAALADRGRVLVRPSGTEPVVRVMVEAPSAEESEATLARLVAVVEHELS
ncbi:MAG TPA: phosphoglucosamine mutase [Thermoleophilaceae bacterium]|nr:phosphoglucosamine mutase [Thermoleophilaceae bacterium]